MVVISHDSMNTVCEYEPFELNLS